VTPLQVGFAKRDITPLAGCILAGNGDFVSEGVHDSLYARAVVFDNGKQRVAMVSCDLLGLNSDFSAAVAGELGEEQWSGVLITCTHTHNGPCTRFFRTSHLALRDESYFDRLLREVVGAIREAHMGCRPAVMKFARGLSCENFNRRLVTPDGRAHFYNPPTLRENPSLAALDGGVTDPELTAIQFFDKDNLAFLTLVQYAAHPLTIGVHANVISADYPGRLVQLLEDAYGVPAVFLQGACGDLHCRGLFAGFERMETMAQSLAGETMRILDFPGLLPQELAMSFSKTIVRLPVDSVRREAGSWIPEIFGTHCSVEMAALSLGPIVFCGVPGELCCEPGLQIKWHSPFQQTWILYNCNAYAGYLILPRGYIEGGYEAGGNCLLPSACQLVADTASNLCEKVHHQIPTP